MVVDPFTALSLASNVVQFVDFGTRISFKIYDLYHSASGFTSTQSEVIEMAHQFEKLAERVSLIQPIEPDDATVIVDHESFQSLLISCKTRANELITIVEDLQVNKAHKLWSSIRQGFRAKRKREEIETL